MDRKSRRINKNKMDRKKATGLGMIAGVCGIIIYQLFLKQPHEPDMKLTQPKALGEINNGEEMSTEEFLSESRLDGKSNDLTDKGVSEKEDSINEKFAELEEHDEEEFALEMRNLSADDQLRLNEVTEIFFSHWDYDEYIAQILDSARDEYELLGSVQYNQHYYDLVEEHTWLAQQIGEPHAENKILYLIESDLLNILVGSHEFYYNWMEGATNRDESLLISANEILEARHEMTYNLIMNYELLGFDIIEEYKNSRGLDYDWS